MLRKRYWVSLLTVCCLSVVIAGCQDKDATDQSPEGATKVETPKPDETPANALQRISPDPFDIKPSALPSDAELEALGPIREANHEFLRFMPDNASSFVVIYPERTIQSPYLKNYSDVAEGFVAQLFSGFTPYFPASRQIPFSNMKCMSMCLKPIKQQPSLNAAGEYVQSSPDQISTCVCTLELNEPVEDLLLLSIFNRMGNMPTESLKPVTIGGMKAYDLLLPTENMPMMERLVFVNDRKVVFASGSVSEVTNIFDSKPGQGALASRILRTNMQDCDLLSLYSTEGVTHGFLDMIGLYVLGKQVMLQFGSQQQSLSFPEIQEHGANFARMMRNAMLRVNLQAPEADNVLQVDLNLLTPDKAAQLQKDMQGPITELVNKMSFDLEKSKQTQIPEEHAEAFAAGVKVVTFVVSLFENLNVTATGTRVQLALKKIPGFDQGFQEILAPIFEESRKVGQTQLDVDAMRDLSRAVFHYVQINGGRFPNYAVMSEDGTPLLSWRVAILPFLGEQDLYNQFRMNEPWDSEHNRTLIDKMPKWFGDPSGQSPAGKSTFRMVGGDGSFLSKHPNGFAVSDLTFPQGTLYMVAVTPENAVEWTRPEYLPFVPDTFESTVKEIFSAMFCNSDVEHFRTKDVLNTGEIQHWVAGTISPRTAAELEAQQRYEQFIRSQQQQGAAGQPAPGQPMSNQPTGSPPVVPQPMMTP